MKFFPHVIKGKPVDYRSCQGNPCEVIRPQEAHKGLTNSPAFIWQPLAPIEANSPCACGCIYVVNRKRQVDITSGEECPRLPVSWTVQVDIFDIFASILSF